MRRHLTYANVVATLALVFAMSGGALAARHYLITSTKQIKPSVLKELRGRTGARGATGATGLTGAAGPTGPPGGTGKEGPSGPTKLSDLTNVEGELVPIVKGIAVSIALCPKGSSVVSGGSDFFGNGDGPMEELQSVALSNHEGWAVVGESKYEGVVAAFAYCANEGQAVTASAITSARRRQAKQEAVALAAKFRHEVKAHKHQAGEAVPRT